ncbi:hypothetical protein Tco_0489158 [Tanacetum coccineum]
MASLPGRGARGVEVRLTVEIDGVVPIEGFGWFCASRDGNSSIDAPNPNSFNDLPNVFTHPPQPQNESYSCELCGNDAHYGYDFPSRVSLVYEQEPATIKTLMIIIMHKIHRVFLSNIFAVSTVGILMRAFSVNRGIKTILSLTLAIILTPTVLTNPCSIPSIINLRLCQQEQEANLSIYTLEPSRCFNSIYYDDDDDEESTIPLNEITFQIPPFIAITPVLPTIEHEDSLIMRNEHLSTIPEKESDEFIKSSVENLVPIPSESEDTDDESLLEEDVPKENFKIYSNPLFKFDDEYISSDVNPLFNELNEDECFDPGGDFILEEIEACPTSDSIPSGIDDADFDPERDILLLEKLLNNDLSSPLPLNKLNFEELKVIKSDVSTDFEDDYYDSEGDIIYLESLLIKDTIPNLPPEVFLDRDPRSLKDEHDNDNLKSMVKVFNPGLNKKIFSPTNVRFTFEDLHYFSLTFVIRIFLPYLTYSTDSSFILSSGSKDLIFDPSVSAYSFYSLEPVAYENPMENFPFLCFCPKDKGIRGESSYRLAQKQALLGRQLVIARIMKTLVLVVLSIVHSIFNP